MKMTGKIENIVQKLGKCQGNVKPKFCGNPVRIT